MCAKVPGVADKGCQPEPERKSLTLEYVDIKYPEDQWTHTYTDGSAAGATRDWGGGLYIRYNDGTAQITIATRKYSTNFKAEAEALKKKKKKKKSCNWDKKQNTSNQAQCGHLHRRSLCPQQTPKSPPERSQWGWNCPYRPRSPDKPNLAVDSSTLRDSRKWASRPACQGGRPAGTRGQIHYIYRWKDLHQNPLQEKMEAATPRLQPVRQPPQTEQDRAGYSVQVENWTQQT